MSEIVEQAAEAPRQLVRADGVSQDDWQRFEPADAAALPAAEGRWLVPLATWLAHEAALRGREVGVLVAPGDDVRDLEGHLEGLALIAVDFPSFVDGRGFSSGRLLRTALGWEGEMRAVGDVLIDTVFYLSRCGFDSFTMKPGHDGEAARGQLHAFSVSYQPQYPLGAAA
ncbi:DUF934 domain-containing protein [Verticiella sediminum]|nr:DUF934 domain-containing protein [Verticiella sediminum]